ncbi:MAG TPA: PqiC family protein [Methylomirabilota bacterium]
MTTPAGRPLVALGLVLVFLAAGCLGGNAPTRFYVLAPGEMAALGGAGALTVGLGPVGLAGYLDRPQIVTRPAADKIDIGEFDQWGEPLREGITRVLAEDLARQMPSARISVFPWRSPEQVRYHIVVDVTRLDGPAGGDLALEARWRILDGAGKEMAAKTTRLIEPTGGAGYSPTVSAMSRALAALSREMAQALAALPQ